MRLFTHYGDLTDPVALTKLLYELQPDEIYHLGAQSHVRVSFDIPEYTFDVTGAGTLRLLEAIRESGVQTRFYQASSSEMFGSAPPPQSEATPFHPRSPYAVAKVAAFWATVNYREAYGMFACNGILFNHESAAPRRDVRDAQDHPRPRAHQARPAGQAVPREPRREARLGLRPRLRRGDVDDAPGGRAGRLRDRHRRDPPRARVPRAGVRARRHRLGAVRGDRPALLPPGRGRRAARRRDARRSEQLGWEPKVGFEELVRIMVDADVESLENQLAGRVTRFSHEGVG